MAPVGSTYVLDQMVNVKNAWDPTQAGTTMPIPRGVRNLKLQFRDPSAPWARDVSVRRALAPLYRLAQARRCAVVVVVHLNKAQGLAPLMRLAGSGAFGNAATRIEAFVASGGTYVYGSYADIDGLFLEQATELDPKRREATLQRIQQLISDKMLVAPIWLNAGINGVGPRVEEAGIGVIAGYAFSAPYEDVKLKGK